MKLYEPATEGIKEDNVKLAVGLGTGLGVCYLARESKDDSFTVFASEACMVKMPLYNKFDREFESYLRNVKQIERRDVELLLGGCGPPFLLQFLASEGPKKD